MCSYWLELNAGYCPTVVVKPGAGSSFANEAERLQGRPCGSVENSVVIVTWHGLSPSEV